MTRLVSCTRNPRASWRYNAGDGWSRSAGDLARSLPVGGHRSPLLGLAPLRLHELRLARGHRVRDLAPPGCPAFRVGPGADLLSHRQLRRVLRPPGPDAPPSG